MPGLHGPAHAAASSAAWLTAAFFPSVQVSNERRKQAVDSFQRDSHIRAALLSITAAGVRSCRLACGLCPASSAAMHADTALLYSFAETSGGLLGSGRVG